MKRIIILLTFAFSLSLFAKGGSESGVEKKSVVVNLGSAKVITLPFKPGEVLKGDLGDTDIDPTTGEAKGDPSNTHFEAKWKDNKIRIRALKVGSGNLEVFDKKGKKRMIIWIYIASPQKGRLVHTIKKLLRDVEGAKIYVSGDDITIDGELFRQKDKERIDRVVDKYSIDGVKIINLTVYSPLFMQAMAKKIEKEINDPQIHVKALKDKFMLTGTIIFKASAAGMASAMNEAKSTRDRYERIAKAYVGEKDYVGSKKNMDAAGGGEQTIVSAIKLQWKPESQSLDKLIRIQFDFVELAKSYMKKFGFKWAPTIFGNPSDDKTLMNNASVIAANPDGSISGAIVGTIKNLFPKLMSAKQFGHARILESSQVITKNGSKVDFKSGKTVLLMTKKDDGSDAGYQKVKFGIDSNYTPEVIVDTSAISMKVYIHYDSIPPTGIVIGNSIDSHTIDSTLIIENGKSAAIGGMVKNISYKMHDKIPAGLEDSLFSIYHSKDFLHDRSQMIMFITPTIVEDATSGSEELKKKFRVK